MTTRHTDEHPIERLSALPALLVVVSLALVATGIGATIQWARTAQPARVITVTGVNGPGMALDRDRLSCRVWGRLVVCASNDVMWRVEP